MKRLCVIAVGVSKHFLSFSVSNGGRGSHGAMGGLQLRRGGPGVFTATARLPDVHSESEHAALPFRRLQNSNREQ